MMMMLGCFRHNEHSNKLVVVGTDMCCAVVVVVGGDGEKELSREDKTTLNTKLTSLQKRM